MAALPALHALNALRSPRIRLRRPRREVQLTLPRLLLPGLAVLAFVKLMTMAQRPRRSRAEALVLTVLLLSVGATLVWLRRSARR
jgi:uncharacterized membrane protein